MITCPHCKQRIRFDRRAFIETWHTSASREQIAARLGWTVEEVASRAYTLRRQGVELAHFKRGRPRSPSARRDGGAS